MYLFKFLSKLALCFMLSACPHFLNAEELMVKMPSGETVALEIEPQDSFQDVMGQIETLIGNESDPSEKRFLLDYSYNFSTRKSASPTRNYAHQLTKDERDEIRYIIKTLAKSSWAQLLVAKSSLKRAGDRVAHVHPYRFVECIFTDEELKAGLHSIKDRKRVWNGFFDGLSDSLAEESTRHNLRPEFLEDFAKIVKVDVNVISGPIQKKDWSQFVELLLKHLPRSGDPDRYKM